MCNFINLLTDALLFISALCSFLSAGSIIWSSILRFKKNPDYYKAQTLFNFCVLFSFIALACLILFYAFNALWIFNTAYSISIV